MSESSTRPVGERVYRIVEVSDDELRGCARVWARWSHRRQRVQRAITTMPARIMTTTAWDTMTTIMAHTTITTTSVVCITTTTRQ